MTSSRALVMALCMLASTALAAKPNVLFITSDDLNNSLGCYGAPAKTPNLDRLAARSVRFDRAYCQFPLCGPSRASIMTGLRPNTVGVLTNGPTVREKLPDVVTLPQHFRQHGYFTARTGKIYHLGIPGGVGTAGPDDPQSWDHTFNPPGAEFNTEGEEYIPEPREGQGFRRVIGKGDGREQADYQAADEAIRLMREKRDKPFFIALGFIRPHVPCIAPRTFFDLYKLDQIKLPHVPPNDRDDIPAAAFQGRAMERMNEADSRGSIWSYYASISFMDAQAGRVLDALEELGLAQNTIVVFLGDHGYLLGEHGAWQKQMLFEPVARIPLLICAPGVKPGATRSLVEAIDIAPTVADLAAIAALPNVDGKSLKPLLGDPSARFKGAAYTQLARRDAVGRSVRSDRYRYTEWDVKGRIEAELYDEQTDAGEQTNLAYDARHEATVAKMKKLLYEVLPPGSGVRPTTRRASQRT